MNIHNKTITEDQYSIHWHTFHIKVNDYSHVLLFSSPFISAVVETKSSAVIMAPYNNIANLN